MARFKVGVQFHPQQCSIDDLRSAWRAADDLGVDSIWVWDHFFPLYGPPNGHHFEGWTLLAAMAVETSHAMIGTLVSSTSYRNADLLADMARTIDHLSGGRAYLGVGAGWFRRDHSEYGFRFGTAGGRLRALGEALPRMRARLAKLNPGPTGPLPILVGGGGEKVTLRLVAEHADAWNTFGPVENFAHKNEVLNQWCKEVRRDPATIERTVSVRSVAEIDSVDGYLKAGAQHVILEIGAPFTMDGVQRLLAAR